MVDHCFYQTTILICSPVYLSGGNLILSLSSKHFCNVFWLCENNRRVKSGKKLRGTGWKGLSFPLLPKLLYHFLFSPPLSSSLTEILSAQAISSFVLSHQPQIELVIFDSALRY